MAFQVSPGVNVSEIDLTTIVPAVATSLAGIAGHFEWGPANQAVLIDTPKTFRNIFGDLKSWNYEEYMTTLNFLGYSRGIQVVRTSGGTASAANANTGGLAVGTNGAYAPNDESDISTSAGGAAGFYARYMGEKGNSLGVSICSNSITAGSGASWGDNGINYWNTFGRQPQSTDNIVALAGQTTYDQVHIVVVDSGGLFSGTKGQILERYEGVSLHPKAKNADGTSNFFKNVINNRSEYIKCGGDLESIDFDTADGYSAFFDAVLTASPTDVENEFTFVWKSSAYFHTVQLTGGAGETSGTLFGTDTGYNILADAEKLDVNLILGGGITAPADLIALKQIAEDRKDCVAFVSCDVGKNGVGVNASDSTKAQKCIDFKNALGSSSYVVVDSGYKKQFDPFNQVFRWVPLNGDIAGLCARTEYNSDAWVSPAGYTKGIINNVEALAFNPNKTYRDRIYPKGINPVISERENGVILLGDKTALSKPSAFDRINVRRLFIVLEKAIATASKFSLFEFNDGFTRSRFTSLVTPFLSDVKSRRGIIDFKVVCDDSNNTPERIDRNEFWADIYIKPNRSINYIQLNFIATRTGGSFTEIGA
jgi:hypothetical protein